MFADKTGGNNLMAEGSFTDNTYATSNYFGVVCDYSTASRYNLYYLMILVWVILPPMPFSLMWRVLMYCRLLQLMFALPSLWN